MAEEGVVKFHAQHRAERLPERPYGPLACSLLAWREIVRKLGLIGRIPGLYDDAGYGNVSGRVGAPSAPCGARAFLITGTQTGGLACAALDQLCLVRTYDWRQNRVESEGATPPSSESMTHGALYDQGPHIRFVLHGHSPVLWGAAAALGLPVTDPSVAYGTPRMAEEVTRLYRTTRLPELGVFAMGGHEDGVVAFGRSLDEAGQALVRQVARAYERRCAADGQVCSTIR